MIAEISIQKCTRKKVEKLFLKMKIQNRSTAKKKNVEVTIRAKKLNYVTSFSIYFNGIYFWRERKSSPFGNVHLERSQLIRNSYNYRFASNKLVANRKSSRKRLCHFLRN